jgi:CelD/BcsL family acetyltransferase involved in cellulose biosynthesis
VLLDPLGDPRWEAFLPTSSAASAFHHPAWLRLLHAQYRYPFAVCGIAAPDGRLVAGLPVARVESRLTGRRLVALPFSDHCAPLVADDAPAPAPAALAAGLDDLRRTAGMRLEVRGTGGVLAAAPAGARFHRHVLTLEGDVGSVERRFRKPQVLRGARRAVREGLHAERRTDVDALASFYRLHVATRARLGVPTQARRFILRFAELFRAGLGFVLMVRRGQQPVAAAVFLTYRGVLTYKYGASDARFLTARPNNLLFLEAIRWGCENGMRALDFGRTDWGHESLRAFKLAWGSEEQQLRYRVLGDEPRRGRGDGLERALGNVLRRSPPVVSRVVGELLYRHVG